MISFPHCKINLGLDVLRKRPDGYHDIETVMFPVRDLCDSLEIIVPEEEKEATELTESGLRTGCPPQENIVMKAWQVPVPIHCHNYWQGYSDRWSHRYPTFLCLYNFLFR